MMIRVPRTTRERIAARRGASGKALDKESFHLRVDEVVGMHIMQKKPFKSRDAVLEALSRADRFDNQRVRSNFPPKGLWNG